MKERKKLREAALCMMIIIFVDALSFITNMVTAFFDGTFDDAFKTVEPSILTAVKIGVAIFLAFELLLIGAQIAIGYKGYKVSKEPSADKGYITWAKVFFVLNIIAVIAVIVTLFDSTVTTSVFSTVLALVSAVCDVLISAIFIKAAKAVRQEVLAGTQQEKID